MAGKFEKFSLITGVLAPGYSNRSDIEKFDLALLEGKNWFVDYRGGVTSRAGFQHCDFLLHDDKFVTAWPFQYGYDIANTYLVIFGHEYIRFLQDGAYVLETEKSVTAVFFDELTSVAHGFSNNDWVKPAGSGISAADGMCCVVKSVTANKFRLEDMFGNVIDFTGATAPFTVARIYTLVTPFTSGQVKSIRCNQIRDTLRISSLRRNFAPYNLTRTNSTSWTLTQLDTSPVVDRPTGLVGTASSGSTNDSSVMFAVTAVDENGEESPASDKVYVNHCVNYAITQGGVTLTWDPQDNIAYFNVYRSIIGMEDELTQAQELGYIGRAYGPQFHDNNIIPDFTRTPPIHNNPFANSCIKFINVTGGGAGYDVTTGISITDGTGTGASAAPVVYGGEILAVIVQNSGENYTAPVITTTGAGAGATFSVELTEASGNYPSLGTVFQQRQVWVSTENNPLTIIGSRPKQYDNYDNSGIVVDSDSYSFEIDSEIITSIRHVLPTKAGLLLASEAGMWQLTGTNGVVTATDATVDRQSYSGVADVGLLQINEDLMLLDNEGSSVRLLAYSDFYKNYASTDVSILSNHFFKASNIVVSWNYYSGPHRLVLAVRDDGSALSGCMVKEHNIFGWTNWDTQGFFRSLHRVKEDSNDTCYAIVERYLQGEPRKFIERLSTRLLTLIDDFIGVDAALTLPGTYPSEYVLPSALTGTISLSAGGAVFTAGDVGKIWRGGGGRGTVTAYTDSTHITVELDQDITTKVPYVDLPCRIASGDWSLDPLVTEVSGLWHLEGMTVNALLDGSAYTDLVVSNGTVTLPVEASRVVVGLQYDCVGRALMPTAQKESITNDRKRITAIAVWQNESRGLRVGTRRNKMYELKERKIEDYGDPPDLQSGLAMAFVDPIWEVEGSFYFEQTKPLPASVLGWVEYAEVGDDGD